MHIVFYTDWWELNKCVGYLIFSIMQYACNYVHFNNKRDTIYKKKLVKHLQKLYFFTSEGFIYG